MDCKPLIGAGLAVLNFRGPVSALLSAIQIVRFAIDLPPFGQVISCPSDVRLADKRAERRSEPVCLTVLPRILALGMSDDLKSILWDRTYLYDDGP